MKHLPAAALSCILLLALAGCAQKAPPAAVAAPPSPFNPVASILDLMDGQIDPAADFLWESVATISTKAGFEEKQPRTDDEWKAVRREALRLIEGTNLLVMDGRRVAHEGQQLDDQDTKGVMNALQSQAAIDADPLTFRAYARALQDSGLLALAAIDKRDVQAFLDAGGAIDEACEQCHLKYWYPDAPPPPVALSLPAAAR